MWVSVGRSFGSGFPQHAVGHVNYLAARLRLSAFISHPEEEEEEEGEEEEGALSLRIPMCAQRGGHSLIHPTDFHCDATSRLQGAQTCRVSRCEIANRFGVWRRFDSLDVPIIRGNSWLVFSGGGSANQRFASHVKSEARGDALCTATATTTTEATVPC